MYPPVWEFWNSDSDRRNLSKSLQSLKIKDFYFSVGGLMVEKPKLDSNSKVIGWDVSWSPQRPFALGKEKCLWKIELFHSK